MRLSDETLDDPNRRLRDRRGFLTDAEVEAAQRADFDIFPEPAEYFADPSRYESLVQGQFSGLRVGPFPSWELNRLGVPPRPRRCRRAVLRFDRSRSLQDRTLGEVLRSGRLRPASSPRLRQSQSRGASGRWSLAPAHHLHPAVGCLRGRRSDQGRTAPVGVDAPLYPNRVGPGEFADDEVAVTGPAGTLFLYTTDVLHRASSMTGEQRSRFVLLADYAARGNPWMGKVSWPGRALDPAWPDLLAKASPRERELFGFPPVGSDYWNEQTVSDVGQRWPGIDMSVYRVR
ncbi:MAG: hypothetical protein R2710_29365 [Acidimicrobiales bacterium]